MGRKRKRIVRTKPIPTLPTVFDCPLCGTSKSLTIEMNKKIRVAIIRCGKCHYESKPRSYKSLDEKVDVFGDWIDELMATTEKKTLIRTPTDEDSMKNDDEKE